MNVTQTTKTANPAWLYLLAIAATSIVIIIMLSGMQNLQGRWENKKAKEKENLAFAMAVWIARGSHGQHREAIQQLQNMSLRGMSIEHLRERDLALAQLYQDYATQFGLKEQERERYLATANALINRALAGCDDREIAWRLHRIMLKISLKRQDWDQVVTHIHFLRSAFPAATRDLELLMIQADSLFKLERLTDALEITDLVLELDRRSEMTGKALRLRGDLFMTGLENVKGKDLAMAAGLPGDDQSDFLEAARVAYEEAMELLPAADLERATVLNGLLQYCITTNSQDAAYEYIKKLKRTICPPRERIRSYLLIAELEENNERFKDAAQALTLSIQEFPNEPKSIEAYFRLFSIYRQQKLWQAALQLLDYVKVYFPAPEVSTRIIDIFLQDNLAAIGELATAPMSGISTKLLEKIFLNIKNSKKTLSEEQSAQVHYLLGMLCFYKSDYLQAESEFIDYMKHSHAEYSDQILYYYLLCAIRTNRAPVVIAQRAHRYLNNFKNGNYKQEVLSHLLKVYYEMGLYAEAVDIAKLAFANDLVRVESGSEKLLREQGLDTVVKIAQCYTRLGKFDMANSLFRSCMTIHRNVLFSGSVYLDWSATAAAEGQYSEASRRLKIGQEKQLRPEEKQRLEVAQIMLSLKMKAAGAEELGNGLIRQLQGITPGKERNAWLKETYEILLESGMSQNVDLADNLLSMANADFPGATWVDSWMLQGLRKKLSSTSPPAALDWMRATIRQGTAEKSRQETLLQNVIATEEMISQYEKNKEVARVNPQPTP